jgi:hypothetical protein
MLICDTICTTYYVDVGNLEEKVFTNLVSKTRSGREEQFNVKENEFIISCGPSRLFIF